MQSVGEILRSERQAKGLSIKDVEAATSIRALYINAIEEANYKIVPGEVYLKGFIRNYANFLGLDGQKMVEVYRQEATGVTAPTVTDTIMVSPQSSENTDKPADGKNVKWVIGGVAAIAIIAAVWWGVSSQHPTTPPQQPQVAQTPSKPATPPKSPAPTPSVPQQSPAAPANSAKPNVIIARYTDECWTQVSADGKDIYEGIPKKGESLTWESDTAITVKFGNAGGVEVTHNGQNIGKIGNKGDVVAKTFAPLVKP